MQATVSPSDSAEVYQTTTVLNINIDSPSSSIKTDLKFENDNTKLSKSEKQNLNQFLLKNSDIFSTSLTDTGKTEIFSHKN